MWPRPVGGYGGTGHVTLMPALGCKVEHYGVAALEAMYLV